MKYLVNWIEKEMHPDQHISSKSTSSEYFYFYGKKVRLSDHLNGEHKDNDLEIICVHDLFGKNKQYIVKEGSSPSIMSVPDVKTLKIVLSTFLFQYKNSYDNIRIKNAITESTQKSNFDVCIDKLKNCGILNSSDIGSINVYMNTICKQWGSMKEDLRLTILHLFNSGKTIEEIKNIINVEFPVNNANNWQNEDIQDNINKIYQYIPYDYKIDEHIICQKSLLKKKVEDSYKNLLVEYENYRQQTIEKLCQQDKDRYVNIFGSLLVKNTDGRYSKLSIAQRKKFRELAYNKVPYDICLNVFNHTFKIKKNKRFLPESTELGNVVNKFLKLYNIGIVKYPDEEDFDNIYSSNFETNITTVESNNVDEVESNNVDEVETNDNNVNVEEIINHDNDIIHFIHDTDKVIKESYEYANAEFLNIIDIHEMFDNNQINILDEVIKKINDTDKYTSFETRRITDVFAKHYSDIWDKLTWGQKGLCSTIITEERMNLNETDFIINKIFDKTSFNWPVTEQCRKDIKMYCQRIKESRMAA